jgi:hypothetical protein
LLFTIISKLIKYDKSADTAIQQIKNRQYTKALEGYSGEILLVGINNPAASNGVSNLQRCRAAGYVTRAQSPSASKLAFGSLRTRESIITKKVNATAVSLKK